MPPLFRPMFSLAAVLTAATPLSALVLPSGTRHAAPPTRRAHLVASADKPVTAAVIGGGLGGLAVAIALRRVGIDAHVYERAAELKGTAGTGLTLWPNGLSALAAIDPGLESLILADGKATTSIEVTTADGLTKLPNPTGDPTRFTSEYGHPMINIHWARLQSALASRLPSECLHLDCQMVDLAKGDDGRVALEFVDGSGTPKETVTADLAIGADGINSHVRSLLVGDGPPRDAGRTIWRSIIDFDEALLEPSGCTMSAGAGKVGFLTDLGDAGLYWSAFATDEALANSSVDRAAFGDDVKSYLLAEFADVYKVAQCIERTPSEMVLERRVADRKPLVDEAGHAAIPWAGIGAVTLLGDAFHAMIPSLGQGANSSFEGAYRLAAALAGATAGDAGTKSVEAALREYEIAQMERVHWIVERSAQQGKVVYEDRDEFMRAQGEAQDSMWGIKFAPLGA